MEGVVRRFGLVFLLLLLSGSAAQARTQQATVGVYPAGTTFTASGGAPAGAASAVSLAMPVGAVDDAVVDVRGASRVAIQSSTLSGPLRLSFRFAHYVSVGGAQVPDALLPWDGGGRTTEAANQPVWLQVTVPAGTAPGAYAGSVQLAADSQVTTIPISVTVYPVTLPAPDQVQGSLLTAFNMNPQTYGNMVQKLYGVGADQSLPGLFSFFSSYRLSPNNWGYGDPKTRHGYTSDRRWWLDKAGQMESAVGSPRQFGSMWIPLSNNRWPKSAYVAGLSPYKPQTWCSYLRSVHAFWERHGWLASSFPYAYGLDESGANLLKTVAQSAKTLHACFPGGHMVITGNPAASNKVLWNGGSDDVDVWTVLASRYYGQYTNPSQTRQHISHATQNLNVIDKVRRHGKQIWAYTYPSGANRAPGYSATEPLSDPRMFVDWTALEGITGILYGEGTTSYSLKVDPLNSLSDNGAFVLAYPGRDAPIPSARLEEIREGIEDWEILNIVRQKHGAATVRKLLSGLFTTSSKGAVLACTIGCQLKTDTRYSWPLYSRDSSTAGKIAQMRAQALAAAS
jgi:hypothetical protein